MMEVRCPFKSFTKQHFSTSFKVKYEKVGLAVLLVLCGVAEVCQSAPGRRERWNPWNPYYYPTARSLSLPTSRPTTTITTTTTTYPITTSRPRPHPRILVTQLSADRRNSRSINSTAVKDGMKDPGQIQFKFEPGNVTAIGFALNDFIKSAEVLVRELLVSTQSGMLKIIGQVDQGINKFQKRLQGSGLRLAFAGQQAAAQTYEALPPFVNQIIRRLGTSSEGRSRNQLTAQLNDAVKNLRELKKMLSEVFDEHEKDFHNVFQDRFTQINQYLGVPELPRRPLTWYP